MKNQKGFAVLELIVIVVVLAVLGFVGYRVYKTRQTASPSATTAPATTPEVKTSADLDKASSSLDASNVDSLDNYDKSLNSAAASF